MRGAEIDLAFSLPESARSRLVALPRSPRADLLRARVELLEFHFDQADALIESLRAQAPPSAAPLFAELDAFERTQRRKIERR
jgi:hypothetical protein